jgi:hypothetical protein
MSFAAAGANRITSSATSTAMTTIYTIGYGG